MRGELYVSYLELEYVELPSIKICQISNTHFKSLRNKHYCIISILAR